jgi:hypothetical protein
MQSARGNRSDLIADVLLSILLTALTAPKAKHALVHVDVEFFRAENFNFFRRNRQAVSMFGIDTLEICIIIPSMLTLTRREEKTSEKFCDSRAQY